MVLRGGHLLVEDSQVQAGGDDPNALALDLEFSREVAAIGVVNDSSRNALIQVSGADASIGSPDSGGGRVVAPMIKVHGAGTQLISRAGQYRDDITGGKCGEWGAAGVDFITVDPAMPGAQTPVSAFAQPQFSLLQHIVLRSLEPTTGFRVR